MSACYAVTAQHGSHLAPCESTADLASQWSQGSWQDGIWKLLTRKKAFLHCSISGRPTFLQCFSWRRKMTVDTQNGSNLLEARENQMVFEKILWVSNTFNFSNSVLVCRQGHRKNTVQAMAVVKLYLSAQVIYVFQKRSSFSVQVIRVQPST